MSLSLRLGILPDELIDRLTLDDLIEWMAYYQLDPFDGVRGDLQSATVASTIANVHRGKGPAFKPKDFMPDFKPRPQSQAQTSDQMMKSLIAWARRHNAQISQEEENQKGGISELKRRTNDTGVAAKANTQDKQSAGSGEPNA